MENMFNNTYSLRTLKLGQYWYFESNCGLYGEYRLQGNQTIYTAAQLINQYPSTGVGTYFRVDGEELCVLIYDSGEMVFQLGGEEDPEKGMILKTLNMKD